MNAFHSPVPQTKPVSTYKAKDLLPLVAEFSEEMHHQDEAQCQGWGIEDCIFPKEAFDNFFEIIKGDDIKKSIDRGFVHVINIQEKEDGDLENSVTLAAGYLNIQQKLIFQ